MKKLIVFVMLCLAAGLFAEPQGESWDGKTITILGGRGYEQALEEKYPGIDIVPIDVDVSTGQNVTMAALVAAGTPPDIFVEFAGRAGLYLVPEFALPLEVDESVWDPAILATYKHDGVLYGLPFSLPVQGMAINKDITDAAGYKIPEGPWTVYDYEQMLSDIKASGYDGWPTYLYAGSSSADYLWLNWWSAFGVELFKDGDYSRSAVNDTPALVQALTFMKSLVDKGYSPPDSAIRKVDEVLPGFRSEKIATTGFRPNWVPSHIQVALNQGEIDEPFNFVVKPFPVYPGVKWPAPIPGVGTCVLAHMTDNADKKKLITDIVMFIADTAQQGAYGDVLTRNDVELTDDAKAMLAKEPETQKILAYTKQGGFMDCGYTWEFYGESREAALPILRDLYNGVKTPEQAAKAYEDAINAILDEYKR